MASTLPLLLFLCIAVAIVAMNRVGRDMPVGLRMIMFGCFIAVLFIPLALIPAGGHWINGVSVSFSEFWRRGGGPLFLIVGALLPIIGYGIATRRGWSRYCFTAFLVVTALFSVISHPEWDDLLSLLFIAFLVWYLFRRHTVRAYFAYHH